MAEVAGLVIGSVQLIDVVLKLKRTFDGVENLPQQVTDLVQEAEIIATQLSTVETELARDPADPQETCGGSTAHFNMAKCVEYCRQALKALYDLTVVFESKLSRQKGLRRGIAMAKLFLQKDQLEKLQNKLDRAVQLLKWAQSCYVQAQLSHLMQMSRSQHHVVLNAITTLQPIPDSSTEPAQSEKKPGDDDKNESTVYPCHSPVSIESKSKVSKFPAARSRRRGIFSIETEASGYTVQVQLPEWISEFVWELHAHRACSAYTYHFRQYRYTTREDPVFRCVRRGGNNVAMLRQLFDKGQASPFDVDITGNGSTLQHLALGIDDIEMSKFLMSLGLGLDVVDDLGERPLPWLYSEDFHTIGLHGGEDLDVLESQPTFLRAIWKLGEYWGHGRLPQFRRYRGWLFPNYDDIPLLARLLIARYMVTGSIRKETFRGETLRFSLSAEGIITPAMVAASVSENLSILHTFTVAFVTQLFPEPAPEKIVTDVQRTLKDLINISTDLHHRDPVTSIGHFLLFDRLEDGNKLCERMLDATWAPGTPFLTLVRVAAVRGLERGWGGLYFRQRRVWQQRLDYLLRRWLSLLASCGVDLQVYGGREHALIFGETRKEPRSGADRISLTHSVRGYAFHIYFSDSHYPPDPFFIYLKDFTYGPEIGDWSMEWEVEIDIDMNEFWNFVEQEERERKKEAPVYGPLRMPGGWVEECSDNNT